MKNTLIGRRAQLTQTGEVGTITKVINRCLWVQMDDGRNLSGGMSYWKVLPK
jgi:hypothetical protein